MAEQPLGLRQTLPGRPGWDESMSRAWDLLSLFQGVRGSPQGDGVATSRPMYLPEAEPGTSIVESW